MFVGKWVGFASLNLFGPAVKSVNDATRKIIDFLSRIKISLSLSQFLRL